MNHDDYYDLGVDVGFCHRHHQRTADGECNGCEAEFGRCKDCNRYLNEDGECETCEAQAMVGVRGPILTLALGFEESKAPLEPYSCFCCTRESCACTPTECRGCGSCTACCRCRF